MPAEPYRIPAATTHQAIEELAASINRRHARTSRLVLLGIANGGITLARRLGGLIPSARVGTIDVSFHRDDIGRNPIPKEFNPTLIPVDVNDATVILVDDVLFTGRTIKAALDELFDHGRPAKVELAVLIDRGHRVLPVAPDYTGLLLDAGPREKVIVRLHPDDPSADGVAVESLAAVRT